MIVLVNGEEIGLLSWHRDAVPSAIFGLVHCGIGDRQNFQARYVLHHAWQGSSDCDAARAYRRTLRDRQESEARNASRLTGWNIADVRKKMNLASNETPGEKKWWELW